MESASNSRDGRSFELLHLNVPLITTRRASSAASAGGGGPYPLEYSIDTTRRVPFLWETVAGVPKDPMRRRNQYNEELNFFPPKPPPGRRRFNIAEDDDGNDGDVDSCSNSGTAGEEDNDDDKVSLPEMGIYRSPSFIMNRFLPAAGSIAAHSTSRRALDHLSRRLQSELSNCRQCRSTAGDAERIQEAHQPPLVPSKACGLEVFFSWKFKPMICGSGSPACCQTPAPAHVTGSRLSGDRRRNEGEEDNVSSKAWKSPGWGLPFLDTSSLRVRSSREEERAGEFMAEFAGERRERGGGGGDGGFSGGGGKLQCSLPRLKGPSEPWLSRALNNANRRY